MKDYFTENKNVKHLYKSFKKNTLATMIAFCCSYSSYSFAGAMTTGTGSSSGNEVSGTPQTSIGIGTGKTSGVTGGGSGYSWNDQVTINNSAFAVGMGWGTYTGGTRTNELFSVNGSKVTGWTPGEAADFSTAIGTYAGTGSGATGGTSYGSFSFANKGSTAIGGGYSTGIGTSAVITNGAIAEGENSVAIGINSAASKDSSVAIGANSIADEENVVSIGSTSNTRKITNLANGINDTDAVNVGQLNTVNTQVEKNTTAITQQSTQLDGVANSLGGGAAIASNGNFTGPSYQIQGGTHTTVGDALAALDTSVTGNTTNLNELQNNISNGTVGLVRQDATTQAITVAAGTGGTGVSMAGTDGVRTLSGLAEGALSASSTEAVTGSQLFATNGTVDTNTADIATNAGKIATNTTAITQQSTQLDGVANSLGGGAAIASNGNFTGPSYQIQGGTQATVGDALAALDTSVTGNTTNLNELQNNISNGTVGLVRQDATTQAITVAAGTGGTGVSMAGTDGVRTLSGLAEGTLSASSTEAVTGSQLFATNGTVDTNTGKIATNTADIATNAGRVATNTTAITQQSTQLDGVANSLGGGAAIASNGNFTGPRYQIQGGTQTTVGDALTALDTSVTGNTTNINDLQNNIGNGSVGLVRQDATTQAITVAAGTGGTGVSMAGTDGVRTLSGLAEGTLSASSTEAVTGSQLFATNGTVDTNTADIATNAGRIATNTTAITQQSTQLDGVANSLGGGAAIASNGNFTGPRYQIQGGTQNTVGDALTALDTSVTGNTTNLNELQSNISNGTVGLVRQDATTQAITVAAGTGGTGVSMAGTDGVRTLSGLAEGALSASSTEAVTGSQLFATNGTVDTNTGKIATNTADIATNAGKIATNTTAITQQSTQLDGVANSLGGGAAIASNGNFTGPRYQIQGGTQTTVGDALTALDTSVTGNTTNINDLQNNIGNGSVGLVRQDATTQAITVAAGTGGTGVSMAGTDGVRTLSGLAEGTLSASSTEAVTGSQLFATNGTVDTNTGKIATNTADIATNAGKIATNTTAITQQSTQLDGVANSLGGGAAIASNGNFTGPRYQIQGGTQTTVGDALTALDTSVTGNTTNINDLQNNIGNGSVGLVRQDATTQAITVAAGTGGTGVSMAGTDGVRTLSGLAEGTLSASSTEAVTGSQLFATNGTVDTNTGKIATNTADIATNAGKIATNTTAITQQSTQLDGVANSLGGGAAIASNGNFTGPRYQIQGGTQTTVGDALTALDTSVTGNTTNINDLQNNIGNGTVGLVRQDATTQAITVAAGTGGTGVSMAGTDGVRTLSGLAEGALSASSTEAVTGSQLFATNNRVANNTVAIAQQSTQLDGVANSLGGGAAIASNGNFTGPRYQIQGGAQTTVGDALTALDTSVTGNTTNINDLQNSIGNGSVGLVRQDVTTQAITVAAGTGGTRVSMAGTDGVRTLGGLADGALSENSTEAVTGSQLFRTNTSMGSMAASLGGGAYLDNNNQFIGPEYTIQGQKKTSVGDALYLLDDAVTVNSLALNGLVNGTSGLVQQGGSNAKITIGASSGGTSLSVSGTDGNRVVNGVANGDISANSSDAVNGSQLYATNQQVAQNANDINKLSNSVQDVVSGKAGLVQQESTDANVSVANHSGGGSVSVNGTDGDRRITGVSDGINDSDAATVGQLKEVQSDIGSVSLLAVNSDKSNKPIASGTDAIALGGNASAAGSNAIAIGPQSESSGEQSTALGTKSRAEGSQSLAIGSNSRATGNNSVALGSNSVATENNTVSLGSAGSERRLTNVARGINATDAATVGQMNDGFASLQSYTNGQVNHLNNRINHVEDKLTAGVASAMALSGIPQAYQPDSNLVGVSGGSYGGETAIAVGISHISENGHWVTKFNASGNSQSDFGGSVGIGYQW